MKKLFIAILLILFAVPGWSATYYVDTTCTDTNPASATVDGSAYDPATPACTGGSSSYYVTMADINAAAATLVPGDTISLRKGQKWEEQLTIPESGTLGNVYTFTAHGTGDKPIISGADTKTSGDFTEDVALEETGGTFSSGFEDEIDAMTVDFTGEAVGGANAVSITSAAGTFNSGADGGVVDFAGSVDTAYAYKDFTDSTEEWARFYVKIGSGYNLGANYNIHYFATLEDDTSSVDLIRVGAQCSTTPWNSCKWFVSANNGATTIYTSGSYGEIVLNTWYRIAVHFKAGTGIDGIARFYLDGVRTGTDQTAMTWSANSADRIIIGDSGAGNGVPDADSNIYYDDVKLDTTDPGAVSLPGGNQYYTVEDSYQAAVVAVYRNDSKLTSVAIGDLNSTTEYTYDATNDNVWLYDAGGNPGSEATIEVVSNARTTGVQIGNRDYITIDGLEISKVNTRAFNLWSGGGASNTDITITNCTLQTENSAGSAGVYVNVDTGDWSNLVISNNTITVDDSTTQRYGINFLKNVLSFDIDGNTIAGAGEDGIVVDDGGSATESYIRNNTLGGNGENSIDVKNTRDVTISNNTCNNDGEANIVIHDDSTPSGLSYNITLEYNKLSLGGQTATPRAGIYMHWSDDNIIRYNWITTSYSHGIAIEDDEASVNNNEIYGNIIFDNGTGAFGAGIALGDCVGTKVYNNTIYNQGTTGHGIYVYDANFTTGITIKNNIIHTAAGDLIRFNSGTITGADVDYNLYYPDGAAQFTWNGVASDNFADWKIDSSKDANGIASDPLMTNPASADFTLQAQSPLIDVGAYLPGFDTALREDSSWPASVQTMPNAGADGRADIGAYPYPKWGGE